MFALPAPTPVTTPVPFTEAILVLLLLHVPLGVASVNEMELPTLTAEAPAIAAIVPGALTVIAFVTVVVQLLATL